MFTMHPTLLVGPADWDPAQMPKQEFLDRILAVRVVRGAAARSQAVERRGSCGCTTEPVGDVQAGPGVAGRR